MSLCRIITLKNNFSLAQKMSTTAELERVPKELFLTGPVKTSEASYQMWALREARVFENNFLLEHDVAISFSLSIVDDLEQKPLFLNKSARHALLCLGEIIDGIYNIMREQNVRLAKIEPEEKTARLRIDFVISRGATAYFMVGTAMCFMEVLDSLLFVRGLFLEKPTVSITSEMKPSDAHVLEILKRVMTCGNDDF